MYDQKKEMKDVLILPENIQTLRQKIVKEDWPCLQECRDIKTLSELIITYLLYFTDQLDLTVNKFKMKLGERLQFYKIRLIVWAAELFIILRPATPLKPDESQVNVEEIDDTDRLLDVIARLLPSEIKEKDLSQLDQVKEAIAKYAAILLDDADLTGDKIV